ncbi:NDP-hexose 2,3-dehydratase family protein [Candidatus Nitrosopelagicus sp.]|nr:NDP-hexose 2,3-dehydratase family protein [Candidatus Nitrosopelagicus sp.]
MIIDEIKSVLEKDGYETNSETISRIQVMLDSIRDDNQINKLDEVIEWFNKKRDESDMIVEEIAINELDKWNVDNISGNINHESGGFFEVIGVKVSNTFDREVGKKGWTQPMIAKNPGGILGILMKKINDVPHYLLQAKAEPGNIGKLQLSPTLQATTSNLLKAHGGIRPLFAEYFDEPKNAKIIYAKWQSEDGGRFHLKSNYNMIVEVDENESIDMPDSFIWVTLYQIKQLLKIENIVGPHIRGIISYL